MIQRIQSLYLLLVAVLTGLMLLMPLGTFLGGTEEMYLTAFGFSDAADGTPVLTAYGRHGHRRRAATVRNHLPL